MNGVWKRLTAAFQSFFCILFHGDLPNELLQRLGKPGSPVKQSPQVGVLATDAVSQTEPPPSDAFDRAVQMLALMQRDGRLIDFLAENIAAYPDAQLGAAVRRIHESCRAVLNQYVTLEPVLNSEEDQPVTVQPGFEPAAIKLIGNVAGEPPIRGLLRHRGWRVKQINLPRLPHGRGRAIVAPAEVEVP
jgi:hypothetical protein